MTAQITPKLIKELRDLTGVGMTQCKKALEECNGDVKEALAHLRKTGLVSAGKKEGRATNEGAIAKAENNERIAIVEINAETDFVVKNDRFQQFIKDIAEEVAATNPASLEDFLAQPYSKDTSVTIDEYRATIVQAIGENIQIRRLQTFAKGENRSVDVYSHMGGKIVTVVELEGSAGEEAFAKDIAMHVAAASPEYLSPETVPAEVIAHEKEIAKSQVQGKPDYVVEKILEGKLNAYFTLACLSNQKFIKDDSITISELVAKHAKDTGKPLALAGFVRWSVGQ